LNPAEKNNQEYIVLGIMSGTSLDGADLALCKFMFAVGQWNYHILAAETIPYPEVWESKLSSAMEGSAQEIIHLDSEYGNFLGRLCKDFLSQQKQNPVFIASHGHTVFHQPDQGFTLQIGKGSCIAAMTGLPVISDFRSLDVALHGQGAPLVPIGDRLLFGDFEYCLNLGGFGNISFEKDDRRIAFDICPVNIVMNHFSRIAGVEFDKDGLIARSGTIHKELLSSLDSLPYYKMQPPKSLGKEWVMKEFFPVVAKFNIPVADILRTLTEHCATQIASISENDPHKKMLVTGGGALNGFLIERIWSKTKIRMILPDSLTINFKEALIFAFLGVLRWINEPNCLSSVTGAERDNCGGSIFIC
jgi:anhydro-N-acetylmuramic acid kinase